MHQRVLVSAIALVVAVSTQQAAAQGRIAVGGNVELGVPVGDLADSVDVALGGTLHLSAAVAPNVAVMARASYLHGFTDADNVTVSAIPVMAGLRYSFTQSPNRPFVFGEFGIVFHRFEADTLVGTLKDDRTEAGLNVGVGYTFGKAYATGSLAVLDLSESDNAQLVLLALGYNFAAF